MGFAGSLEPGSDPPQVLSASGQRSGVKGECLVRVATGRFRATTSGRDGLCRPLGGFVSFVAHRLPDTIGIGPPTLGRNRPTTASPRSARRTAARCPSAPGKQPTRRSAAHQALWHDAFAVSVSSTIRTPFGAGRRQHEETHRENHEEGALRACEATRWHRTLPPPRPEVESRTVCLFFLERAPLRGAKRSSRRLTSLRARCSSARSPGSAGSRSAPSRRSRQSKPVAWRLPPRPERS